MQEMKGRERRGWRGESSGEGWLERRWDRARMGEGGRKAPEGRQEIEKLVRIKSQEIDGG